MVEAPCRGAKKIRGNLDDGNEMLDCFMEVYAAFTEQMKKVESENPAQFETFKAGLNGVLDGKEVEGN